eukprot:2653292-Ditylum_brightwellii.AAC.1
METSATLTEEATSHLTLDNIKDHLKKRGKRLTGNKSELLQMLLESIKNDDPFLNKKELGKNHEFINGLEPVSEPLNEDTTLK